MADKCIDCGMEDEDELQECEICDNWTCADCIQTVYNIGGVYKKMGDMGKTLICRQCFGLL